MYQINGLTIGRTSKISQDKMAREIRISSLLKLITEVVLTSLPILNKLNAECGRY